MEEEWFPLNRDLNDVENVLNFIELLPKNFDKLINRESSNFLEYFIAPDKKYNITPELFMSAYDEAVFELNSGLIKKRREINLDYIIGENNPYYNTTNELRTVGFTGNSLIIKARLINKLWKNLVDSIGGGIIDFSKNSIIKLIRKLLNFLNSILNSLKVVLLSLDPIKEIKEIMENYLDIGAE